MKAYEEYQDSCVEWIGDIPKGWNIMKFKFISELFTGNSISDDDKENYTNINDGYSYISTKDLDVESQQIDYENGMVIPFSSKKFKKAQTNTILLCIEGGSAGKKIAYTDSTVCFGNKLCCIKTNSKAENKYLFYFCNSDRFTSPFNYNMNGLIGGVSTSALTNFIAILPPLPIQTAIVSYLDCKTAKIDEIISDKRKFITLLKEKRQSIISESITKGLDKGMLMKNSAVDWIGDVPSHWDIKKMKWMFEIAKRLYYKEDRDVLSITQNGLKVKNIEANDGQLAQSYVGYQIVNIKDFAMNSMDLLTGYVDCSVFEGVTSPDYRVFRFIPNKIQSHHYYKYLFQMCYTDRIFYGFGQGVSNLGRWRLQTDVLLNFLLPQPSLEEQVAIADYLDHKTARIDNIIENITTQIEKLKEYRQCIISEVVTGKAMVENLSQGGLS